MSAGAFRLISGTPGGRVGSVSLWLTYDGQKHGPPANKLALDMPALQAQDSFHGGGTTDPESLLFWTDNFSTSGSNRLITAITVRGDNAVFPPPTASSVYISQGSGSNTQVLAMTQHPTYYSDQYIHMELYYAIATASLTNVAVRIANALPDGMPGAYVMCFTNFNQASPIGQSLQEYNNFSDNAGLSGVLPNSISIAWLIDEGYNNTAYPTVLPGSVVDWDYSGYPERRLYHSTATGNVSIGGPTRGSNIGKWVAWEIKSA